MAIPMPFTIMAIPTTIMIRASTILRGIKTRLAPYQARAQV